MLISESIQEQTTSSSFRVTVSLTVMTGVRPCEKANRRTQINLAGDRCRAELQQTNKTNNPRWATTTKISDEKLPSGNQRALAIEPFHDHFQTFCFDSNTTIPSVDRRRNIKVSIGSQI